MDHYKFFSNKECEFFPCHDVKNKDDFNCLFCYCPLYTLGDQCGGNFKYTETGIKDCSGCMVPHSKGAYDYIIGKSKELLDLAAENRAENRKEKDPE